VVERLPVEEDVVGSIPIGHPKLEFLLLALAKYLNNKHNSLFIKRNTFREY
jgi:hypothetical protein